VDTTEPKKEFFTPPRRGNKLGEARSGKSIFTIGKKDAECELGGKRPPSFLLLLCTSWGGGGEKICPLSLGKKKLAVLTTGEKGRILLQSL